MPWNKPKKQGFNYVDVIHYQYTTRKTVLLAFYLSFESIKA
jgi:hypothetical protein